MKGKGKFAVILKKMTNSGGKSWGGGCCDGLVWCDACETYFKVCLTAFPRPTSVSNCLPGPVPSSLKLGGNSFSMNYKVEKSFSIKTVSVFYVR